MLKPIEVNEVIAAAQVVSDQAMARLRDDIQMLHARGYHDYATAMSNMKFKIERSLIELADELVDNIESGPGERGAA